MSAKEFINLSIEELSAKAAEMRQTLVQDNLKLRTGSLDNIVERTNHKRDLARMLTVASQRKIAAKAALKAQKALKTK